MTLYRKAYAIVLRKDFMLIMIALVLMFVTFAFWIGIPIILVGNFISNLKVSIFIQIFCISLSVGLSFSLFFIPIHLKVARVVGEMKTESTLKVFSRLHFVFVLLSTTIFYVMIILIRWTAW